MELRRNHCNGVLTVRGAAPCQGPAGNHFSGKAVFRPQSRFLPTADSKCLRRRVGMYDLRITARR
jgi:hypothetical protein